MKAKFLILTMLSVAVTFMSCDKNNEERNEPQSIMVKLPSTRAVEDPASAFQATTLENVIVFLMNGGSVKQVGQFSAADILNKNKLFENVQSTISNVIVLANVPSAKLAEVLALSNANEIRTFDFTVASQQTTLDKVTLSGEGVPVDGGTHPSDPGKTYKTVTIDLYALTARFEIGAVTAGEGVEDVKIQGVFLNCYYDSGDKADVARHLSDDPVWNFTIGAGLYSVNPTITFDHTYTETAYFDGYNATVTPDGKKCFAYQVFAGDQIPHIVLLVSGKYKAGYYDSSDPNSEYFVKYITFKGYKNSSGFIPSIAPNMIYKIGFGVEGIKIDAVNLTENPEPVEIDLNVNVVIKPWIAENITPSIDPS